MVITPIDQLDASLKVDLPLVAASSWYKTAAAKAEAEAERETVARDQARCQVVIAYYAHVSAQAVRASAQRSLAVAEQQLTDQAARQAAGTATDLEVARAEAEVERNRQVLADADSLGATSRRSLRTLSSLEAGAVPALPADDLHPELPLESLEGRAEGLPTVRAADRTLRGAQSVSTAAHLALLPSVDAQFTERLTNATGFQNANALYSGGLVLNWRMDWVTSYIEVAPAAT